MSYLRLGFLRDIPTIFWNLVHAVVIRTFSYNRPDCVAGRFESSLRPMNNLSSFKGRVHFRYRGHCRDLELVLVFCESP